eukprot:m.26790 g.26790  ORF g.26790 m.26790 type:complete len:100 (+) comp29521_c0_seq1:1573-1872(+)
MEGHRHYLYTAYRHVSPALKAAKKLQDGDTICSADLTPFVAEVDQCDEIVGKMQFSQHRYYPWICRSIARLRLIHAQLLKRLSEKQSAEQALSSALKMI